MQFSGGGVDRRAQAQRWLEIANRLLTARDLVGCKRFAERALDLDPLFSDSSADSLIAAADVLLSSQSSPLNCYSILALKPPSSPADIAASFRRFSLLLNNLSNSVAAAAALDLISHAYSVLSDPQQKTLIDSSLRDDGKEHADLFWTACSNCCHVHQYPSRVYINRTLKCPSCKAAFCATELPSPPSIVPGTDMYFCSWGFFPLGFPGTEFPKPITSNEPKIPSTERPTVTQARTGRTKALAVKKVGSNAAKKKDRAMTENVGSAGKEGNRVKPVVIDINEEWDVNQETMGGMQGEDVDISSFDIEIDVDNMQSFSFL